MTTIEQVREELLSALSQLSRLRPEWRLGQTMANLAMTAGRLDVGGVWELEDEEALAAARTLIDQSTEAISEAWRPAPGPAQSPLPAPHDGMRSAP